MIFICNPDLQVPCCTTVRHNVIEMCKGFEIKGKHRLRIPGRLRITTYDWSSRIYRGNLTTALPWVDMDEVMRSILHDFSGFPTFHKAGATTNMLYDVMTNWNITSKIQATTTDNASDMVEAMRLLTIAMNNVNGNCPSVQEIHIRCIDHVVNLGDNDCLRKGHQKSNKAVIYCQQFVRLSTFVICLSRYKLNSLCETTCHRSMLTIDVHRHL